MKLNLFILCLLLLVGESTFASAKANNEALSKGTQIPATESLGEDPGPVYTRLMYEWAKVTNFSQNASQVIVAKLKLDLENDPKLQKMVTPAFLADLQQFFYELFLSPDTIKELAKVYSQYFTIDEVQDLLNFYRSPVGQKLIKFDPEIKIKTQQIGMNLLKKHEKEYMKIVAKYIIQDNPQKMDPQSR